MEVSHCKNTRIRYFNNHKSSINENSYTLPYKRQTQLSNHVTHFKLQDGNCIAPHKLLRILKEQNRTEHTNKHKNVAPCVFMYI